MAAGQRAGTVAFVVMGALREVAAVAAVRVAVRAVVMGAEVSTGAGAMAKGVAVAEKEIEAAPVAQTGET